MEIKIRGVDVGAVKVLDDLAKKSKMSRNEYLKRQLERLAWLDKTESERNRFEEALKEVAVVLINLQNKIEEDGATIKQLKFMLMQAMDVTEEEMNNFINEFGLPEGDV